MGLHARSVAVVMASAGRPELLGEVLSDLAAQTHRDFNLVISVPDDASLPQQGVPAGAVVTYARGLAAQRNAGLDAVPDATHVFCFDDDAVVRPDFLANALDFFDEHPTVVALTGRVVLDGATGDEVPRETAVRALATSLADDEARATAPGWNTSRELYGCNFAFRPTALAGERFDGRLPLYSWLEDHDFARRARRHGELAVVEACVIVHRGVKSGGRMAHERLGYSQVMNPVHLWHAGSFPLWLTLYETVFRVSKNLVWSVVGAERSWRRERLRGNATAAADLLRRRVTPERILDIPVSRGV